MSDTFDAIPAELKALRQWVNWKSLPLANGKTTKVPVSPLTGYDASVTDPRHWADFATAVQNVRNGLLPGGGIGFVFTPDDPYAGIDLDSPIDGIRNQDQIDVIHTRHWRMIHQFGSYTEWSPSGLGAHIIIKASVPDGKRREAVELYSSGRFFTFTGNAFQNVPIIEAQGKAQILWEELGGGRAQHVGSDWNYPQTQSDEHIIAACMNAANKEMFLALFSGNWQGGYPSQSEADLALTNILCFYSDNREQVRRLFLQSGLGQRDKAKVPGYIERNISKGYDQKIALVNMDHLRSQAMQAISNKLASLPVEIPPNQLLPITERPDGLLGEIADFIYASAPRPVAEIALMGAIGLMCGITGRSYVINGAGLNQYLLLLADTGRGKEAISSGVSKLMHAVTKPIDGNPHAGDLGFASAVKFIGPQELASAPAILKYLAEQPSFVSIIGEFGLKLRKWTGERASSVDQQVRSALLDLYGKSGRGNVAREIIYSDKRDNTKAVERPALSILGESTSARFLDAIDESMISEGFLPRFLTVEYEGPRPPLQESAHLVVPSMELIGKMRDLCMYAMKSLHDNSAIDIQITPEASAFMRDFDHFCDRTINANTGNEVSNQLWSRALLKLYKLAGLYAVGEHYLNPVVNMKHATWAKGIVVRDVERMIKRFAMGDIGGVSDSKQISEMCKAVVQFYKRPVDQLATYGVTVEHKASGQVPYVYLSRRLIASAAFRQDKSGSTNAIRRTIQTLVDRGTLTEVQLSALPTAIAGNKGAKVYILADASLLDAGRFD